MNDDIDKAQPTQEQPAHYKCPTCEHEQLAGEMNCNNCGRTYLAEAPPTQPAQLSDDEILNCFYASKSEGMLAYMLAVGRAIEAHCRGGK